jgi:hypothetical protein
MEARTGLLKIDQLIYQMITFHRNGKSGMGGINISPDQLDAMKRGGHPTLEELSAHLVFSPLDASIRLSGARMMLQRAALMTDLRDVLVRRHGLHDAKVTIMRIGFEAGQKDARFVQEAWPNINVGDAFTAGTRLHMISGVVGVETLGNDFDFRRGRYSSEFLWHNSVEATEFKQAHGPSHEPVCWMQTGYAAGYATHYFQRLVIYKELQCAGMGHKCCHLKGGTADRWDEDDPVVALFRKEIVPGHVEPQRNRRRASVPDSAPVAPSGEEAVDRVLLAPVAGQIRRLAGLRLPVVFCGPVGSGRYRAALAYAAAAAPGKALRRVHGASPEAEAAIRDWIDTRPTGQAPETVLLLEDIEDLAPFLQLDLADRIERGLSGLPLLATTRLDLSAVLPPRLRPDLIHAFEPVRLPGLAARPDVADLAQVVLATLAGTLDMALPRLSAAAERQIAASDWPGNLPELRSVLRQTLLAAPGAEIGPDDLRLRRADPGEAPRPAAAPSPGAAPIDLDAMVIGLCEEAVRVSGGNIAAAARRLGLTRAQLAYRLRTKRVQAG